jgi:hypothetical protein
MAAALVTLIWASNNHTAPTTFTLCTDSSIIYHCLLSEKGTTLRQNQLLQKLFVTWLSNKQYRAHALVLK